MMGGYFSCLMILVSASGNKDRISKLFRIGRDLRVYV
jgi:hypothetical protein